MKTFKAKLEFVGLAGKYVHEYVIKARNLKSAEKKAYASIGDRSCNSVEVVEVK